MKFDVSQKMSYWLRLDVATIALMSSLLTGLQVLNATTIRAETSSPQPNLQKQQPAVRRSTLIRLPIQVRTAVLQTHARQLGIPISQLRVVSFSQESWSDSCLGLGKPEESCGMGIVDGWRVEISNGTERWFYRTDSTARSLRIEDSNQAGSLPSAIAQKVLAIAAKDLHIPVSQLTITAARPQLWNGCLGVAGPNEMCSMIAIPGWQAIVAAPQQYWVYHLNQTATLVKRNSTTSGKGTVVPAFWQPGSDLPPVANDVVFQSITTGGIAGQSYKTLLQKDGRVMRIDLRQQPTPAPTLIRQLSARQMQAFMQVLQQNELADFWGFNYAPIGGADYFTIALMLPGEGRGVQYADIIQDQTPPKLQRIIQAWNRISHLDRR